MCVTYALNFIADYLPAPSLSLTVLRRNDAQANVDQNGIEQTTVGPHRGFRLKQRGNDTNSDGEYGCKRISQP